MKHRILTATALAALMAITGCSNNPLSPGNGAQPGASATTAISEQRAENDFSRYGAKLIKLTQLAMLQFGEIVNQQCGKHSELQNLKRRKVLMILSIAKMLQAHRRSR
jgi:hypothetical protein